jgi:hypothetical protein
MQLTAAVSASTDPQVVASLVSMINVSLFDSEARAHRVNMVRQRFVLGLVEMFEQFPDMPYARFIPGRNTTEMVVGPVADHPWMESRQSSTVDKLIRKSLQTARASISPGSRDTRDALGLFFGGLVGAGQTEAVLPRFLFQRSLLGRICDPSLRGLTPDLVAEIKAELLGELAAQAAPSPATPRVSASKL